MNNSTASTSASPQANPAAERLRILFALPGFHRVERGAEITLEYLARELAQRPQRKVTVIGSGQARPEEPYDFVHAGCITRERFQKWPKFPLLRSDYMYEELTFASNLLRRYRASDFDATLTCAYPFTNWALRWKGRKQKTPHIFVTQNGDWPARRTNSEYRLFSCDGLVCTNIEYFERHQENWHSALIPNGVDIERFQPGSGDRSLFSVPENLPIVLMVNALIPSKRVIEGIEMVAQRKDLALVIAGDGPMAAQVDERGQALLGDRYCRLTVRPEQMPGLYQSADVLLHMSQVEPFGNIYIEALASELPVVAHATANTRWIFEDRGILVDTSSTEEVLSGITHALGANEDTRRNFRELAIRRFSWSVIAAAYSQFIDEIKNAGSA